MGKSDRKNKKRAEPESSSEESSDESSNESSSSNDASSSNEEVESTSREVEEPKVGSKRQLTDKIETPAKRARGGGSVTLFVGNLPWSSSEEEIREFFGDFNITSMRLMNDRQTGQFKGFCYVDFADSENAEGALELAGSDFNGRAIKVDHTQTSSAGDQEKSLTVYVGNLSYDSTEDSVRDFFAECGAIASFRMITDYEGNPKGFGYIEFEDQDSADTAVTYHGSELDGRNIRVTYDSKRPDNGNRGGRGRGGRGGRGGFGDRRGGFGGDRGGFRGGRGGFGGDRGGFRGGRGGRGRGGRGGFGDRRGGFGGDRGGFRGGRGGDRGGRRGAPRGGTDSFRGKKITFD